MRLTKKLEAEILEVYNTYWDAFFKGDLKSVASLLDDNCHVIGSSVGEVFNDKRSLLKYLKATIGQIKGKAELRNRKISVTAVGKDIMIHDQSDLYLLIDDTWTFYGHGRASTLFSKKNNKWKITHLHRSLPDYKAGEGEQVNTAKIKAENLQLRDAVKRRTVELENKNRELEIESAVERVRAKTLAMHRSEEIHEVVRTLRNELFGLKLTGVTAVSICLRQDDGRVRLWDITDLEDTGRYTWDVTFTMNEIDPRLWIRQIWSSKKKIIAFEQDSNDLKRTLKWLSQYDKKTADEITELIRVNKIKRGWHRAVKLANGRLITDFINEPPAEIESILLKMGAAFDLAYKRFLDLKNAETQAKEARIELALERVRARAMAMHNSDELAELVSTVFNELTHLDFKLTSCIIWIHDSEKAIDTLWIASAEMNKPAEPYQVTPFHKDFFRSVIHAWKSKDPKWVYTFAGPEKRNFEKAFFKELPNLTDSLRKALKVPQQAVFSASFNNFGGLEIVETEALTDEKFEILHRFGRVFDLSYTRFNDLKKAEAQTKEAHTEAALERVRSQSMAMHKSNDLQEVIKVVTEQLFGLGLKFDHANFSKITSDGSWDLWVSSPKQSYPARIHVPYIDNRIFNDVNETIAKGTDFLTEVYSTEEKNGFFTHFFENTIAKNTPEERKQYVLNANGFARSVFLTKNIWFSVGNYRTSVYTDEENAIFKRFANVFEQVYTRFLDLQKAEAQAKEAQIEAALERVRSRSMAMHKSDDLHEVIKVVTEQLSVLGVKFNVANFAKIDPDGSWDLWLSTPERTYPALIHVPYLDHPIFNRITEEIAKGNDFFTHVYTREEKNIFFHHFFENTIAKNTPEERKQYVYNSRGFTRSLFLTKNIWFSVSIYDTTPFTDEENAIFKRFANVFEQAYTRFLDLQRAESQAREAQIEAALERVRARAMAMQSSDELRELIGTVFTELTKLDLVLTRCVIWILDKETKAAKWWMANSEDPGNPAGFYIHYHESLPYQSFLSEWEKQTVKWVYDLNGQEKKDWDDFLFSETELVHLPEFVQEGMRAPERILLSATFNNFGAINVASLEPLSDEHYDILLRFAKVFDLTYTRFNDLKQAEAQAKEAGIQLALERVRARTMAMQKSDELREGVLVIYEQLQQLGFDSKACNIVIIDKVSGDMQYWVSGFTQETFPEGYKVPYLSHPYHEELLAAGRQNKKYEVLEYSGEMKKSFDEIFFTQTDFRRIPEEAKNFMKALESLKLSTAFFTYGALQVLGPIEVTEEQAKILQRFAQVFDLTYTRFLDLQKAEAQAKEAKIEAALERVRARSMGMQKSDELAEVVAVLYKQFEELDFGLYQVLVSVYDKKKNLIEWWSRGFGGIELPQCNIIPIIDHPFSNDLFEKWENGVEYYPHILEGELKQSWDEYLFTQTDLKNFPQEVKDTMRSFNKVYLSDVFMKYGSLQAAGPAPLPDEKASLLKRFVKVLDLAYTRMKDLQNAEAQASEAKIELALERVRARTMAMHKSEELAETAQVLFHQLQELGGIPDRIAIGIVDANADVVNFWTTDQQGSHISNSFSARLSEPTTIAKTYNAWKDQQKSLIIDLHGEELKEWIHFAREEMGIAVKDDQIKDRRVHSHAFFSHGWILVTSHLPQSAETIQILERFASVFNLTYRRFLDLQKAEAQAREAQIEAALEKVRSRSLAMHKSDEMEEVLHAVFERLKELEIEFYTAIIILFDEGSKQIVWWLESKGKHVYTQIIIPYENISYLRDLFEAREKGMELHSKCYVSEEKQELFHHLFDHTDLKFVPGEQKKFLLENEFATISVALSRNTAIHITSYSRRSFSDEDNEVLKRFAKVFDQAYTRFRDLQKAEAQAREAQIETALEKVRSRSLAMHKAEELGEVATVVFEKLRELDIPVNDGVAIVTHIEGSKDQIEWMESPGYTSAIKVYQPYYEHPILADYWKAKNEGLDFIAPTYTAEENKSFLNHIFEHTDFKHIPQEIKDHCLAAGTYSYSAAFQKNSSIFINDYSGRSLSEQEIDIVKRFSKVFEQAYVRFLDLQKAELLAREAQIEASLEKVRSHTMGMRTSEDLANVASVMFDQMRILGGDLFSFGIVLCDKHENMVEQWHSIPGAGMMAPFFVPVNLDHIHQYRYDQWKTGTELFSIVIPEDYIAHHFELMLELPSVKAVWEGIAAQSIALPPIPTWEIDYGASFRYGYLLVSALKPFEEDKIFPRFAKVFEQAYTRFLDLQKAEAQAREAQIEAALEKVRSRSLAMHKSDELIDVIEKIYIEFQQLGFDAFAADLMIFTEDRKGYDIWVSREDGTEGPYRTSGEILHHPHHIETMNAWINGDAIRIAELKGELLNSYVKMVVDASHFSKDGKNKIISLDNLIHTEVFTKHGCIRVASTEKRTEEQLDIQKRFAKVFDQAYTRFLDLQKAETQAKEARIEIALERIRARALAMHKSDELMEVAKVLREQMALLGQPELEASVVHLYQEDPDHILSWRAYRPSDSHSKIAYGHMSIPKNSCEFVREWLTKFYSEEKEYTIELSGAKQDEWYDLFFKLAPDVINSMRKEKSIHEKRYYQFSKFSGGALLMVSKQEPSIEVVYLQKRAAMVFDLAYRRFLDLQKTEAQAREAQIEAALERVRSKTMAMQRSEELDSVIKTVYAELKQLDVSFERCFIMIFDEQKGATWWMGSPDDNLFNKGFYVQYHNHPPHLAYLKGWEARQQRWEYLLGGQIKKDWDEFIFSKTELSQLPPPIIQHMSSFEHAYLAASFESFGCMTTGGAEKLNEESFNVLNRFAKVFDQTYRRFLDLQKAEAQAREATIEAALERVRGKAMAMHSSKDLATTIGVFYHELEGLNLTPRRCGVGLINKETWTAEISTMNATADGQGIELVGVLDMKRHPVLTSVYNNWLTKTEYHPVLRGNEIKEYYQLVRPQVNFPDYPNDTVQYGYFFFFEEGGVYAWTEKELNEDELKIYRRFTSVLSLTYKRYKDLKDAEARAQTAIKDAALDRIRADIASMRTINDLDRITPLIWNELTVLGIPFIRCGVFIMDDEEQLIHTFLSTPDGKAIAAFHLPYDTPGPISKVIDGWRYKKIYLDHWGEEEFVQFADILMKQGALNSREQYLKTIPHGGFYLHFLPFLQGMLYVGNTTQLGEDEIVLIQHVADAFSTAYARYEDFNKLELAKQTVEKTLTDLKQAQQQLVQSEKMASLGELTAGIAHEIQNPLNFVNNFSDVSNELLEEMKQELATGNTQQAMYIANDVIDNLEKILHHGKRADAIVKGMLQHSRTSSGQKEPTDINILADEYLRLAFHGLRAKDKSFNAKFETDFDNSIGKLNVIPQDIGRVILNLINNAFYTVTEKKKQGAVGFEPTVTVTTVKDNGKIEIKVKDNGNGIPQKNLDRIFQPFFTTKPTGQGTGLGLSLAYDIVTKGHGGELKVETREGEGSEFIIQLPISKTTES